MTEDKRLGPPPVEPLSDAAWSRVERGVWSELDAGEARTAPAARRRWLVAGPLVAAAAIVALVVGLRWRAGSAEHSDEPSRVVSGAAASAVTFGEAHIALAAETALVLSHEAGHPVVAIERGAAWFTVSPRAGRPDFIVRAGDATVNVVGTRFRVARSEERITVEVEHGLVNVRFRGGASEVAARQHWSSDLPGQTSTIAIAPTAPAPDAPAASVAPTPAPEPAPAPPAVEPSPAPSPASRSAPSADVQRPAHDAKASPTPRPPAASAPLPPPDVDHDRKEYDRLAALEARHPDAALAGYLALARSTGPWADPALFAAARLASDRRDRRAAALLERYLERFPGGANATDARQLLVRLQGDRP